MFGAYQKPSFLSALFILTASLLLLTACEAADNYSKADRDANLEVQDYRDLLSARDIEEEVGDFASPSSIPDLQSYVSQVNSTAKAMPLVSISVNQSIPLRDVLFELAKQADYDIELDPNIRGSIIFTARDKPFDVVIERIARVSGLRYKFDGDTLRVEVDAPYIKTYKVDYLNYIRSNTSSVRNSVAVVSGDGADTGSGFEAKSESESDFWGELETNLAQILGGARATLLTSSDPSITAMSAGPDVAGSDDAVLDIASLPVDGDNLGSGAGNLGAAAAVGAATFSVNRQAGLVNVYASDKGHQEIFDYLTELRRSMTAQVLIEAKILEVSLQDRFSSGIDWRALQIAGGEAVLEFGSAAGSLATNTLLGTTATAAPQIATRPALNPATDNNFVIGFLGNDIEALVQAISSFGNVRALASPRLTVLNNQSAVLNVATNRVFFELDVETETTDFGTSRTVESEIRNVPEGILVNVQPSINLTTKTISMSVRPTITRVVREIQDPAVALTDPTVRSEIPELNVQEIDSIIQVKSGQPVVMGGLLQDRVSSDQESIPLLGEMPIVGSLFRNQGDSIVKTELVILLKATIVEGDNTVSNADRDLYRAFAQDRRPFKL